MTVETLKHTFRNQNLTEYNDDVFPGRTFDARDCEFAFALQPSSATLFWRFGLAFSRTKDFAFDPSRGRYNNEDLIFVEINVGGMANNQWEHPNNIALSSYYITAPTPPYDPANNYPSGALVSLSMRYLEDGDGGPNILWLKYDASDHTGTPITLAIGDYRFFRAFAWADSIPFELEVSIDIFTRAAEPQFWLLRLMENTWPTDRFSLGSRIWHGSRTGRGQNRLEYDLYRKMRKGEKVLGVSIGEDQRIICQFEVEEPLHSDSEHGEIVWLRVVRVFFPYIPLPSNSIYRHKIDDSDNRHVRLMDIGEDDFRRFAAPDLDFPMVLLSEAEKKYLGILYVNFQEGKNIPSTYSLPQIWNDELPKSFRPEEMDPQLASRGNQITLLGICQIHPESLVFYRFERAIYTIKEILGEGNSQFEVNSNELKKKLTDFSEKELLETFKLLESFQELSNGVGALPTDGWSVKISRNEVFEEYRQFSGLRLLMAKHLQKNPLRNGTIPKQLEQHATINVQVADFNPTNGLRRSRSDFAPVLGIEALAARLGNLIYHLPPDSQMVGIFGKWGRGKSFLLDELWKYAEKTWDGQFIKIVYHAWKYQETPASWAYLYEQFADAYLGKRAWGNLRCYYWKIFRLNLRRLGVIPIVIMGLSVVGWLLWLVASPIFLPKEWYLLFGSDVVLTISLAGIFRTFKKELSPKAIELIKKYSVRHSFKSTMGLQADIQEELITLLKRWLPDRGDATSELSDNPADAEKVAKKQKVRIFLIVEDIDRCKEDRVIENIDALRVLLEDPEISRRLLIVAAIDERILQQAIQNKYASLVAKEKAEANNKLALEKQVDLNELVSEYIDKLFIAAIKLGDLSEEQRVEFLKEAIKKDVAEENTSATTIPRHVLSMPNSEKGLAASKEPVASEVKTALAADKDFPDKAPGSAADTPTSTQGTLSSNGPETWRGLTAQEVNLLTEIVRSWELSTPRRINIFYHRYLLCKNTLIASYLVSGQPNPWQDREGINTILYLLRHYGGKGSPDDISKEKTLVQRTASDLVEVKHAGSQIKKNKRAYLILLEILETVVAY